jgi:hypothetical protein
LKKTNKNKIVTLTLVIILAFVAGAGIAVKLTSEYYEDLFNKIEFYNPSFNINETVQILKHLRNEKYDKAIHYTEWRLDDNIMNLSNSLNAYRTDDKALLSYVRAMLVIAAEYRKEYPYDIRKTLITKKTVNTLLSSVLKKEKRSS